MADVAHVVGNAGALTTGDQVEADLVAAQGHVVWPLTASDPALAEKAAVHDVVLVAGSALPGDVGTKLRGLALPVIVHGMHQDGSWQNFGLCTTSGQSTISTWRVHSGKGGRDETSGLPAGAFEAWTAAVHSRYTEDPIAGAELLTYHGSNTARHNYFIVNQGTTLAGGGTAAALRIALAGHDTAVATYATAAWKGLLAGALRRAAPAPPPPEPPSPSVRILAEDPIPVGATEPLQAVVDLNGGTALAAGDGIVWSVPGMTVTGADTLTPSVSSPVAGDFTATVTVKNQDGKTATASTVLHVTAVTVPVGISILNGSSFDPAGVRILQADRASWLNLRDGIVGPWTHLEATLTVTPDTVIAGGTFTLTAAATGGAGPYTYTFQQLAGTTATLTGTGDTRTGTAPDVAADEILTFRVTASDGTTTVTSNTVDLAVTAAGVAPAAVALFVGDAAALQVSDTWIRDRLLARSDVATVTPITDDDPEPVDGTYALYVVAPSANGTTFGAKCKTHATPMVHSSGPGWDEQELINGGATNTALITDINITDPTHPLASGLTGVRTVLTTATALRSSAGFTASASLVVDDQAGQYVVAGYDVGDTLDDATLAPARRVAIGYVAAAYYSNGATRLTADGTALFDAAVSWALGGS